MLVATGSLAAFALAGCVGASNENEDATGGEGFETGGSFELPTDPGDDDFADRTGQDVMEVVTIQREADPQFLFDPPFVRVDRGTTVRWVNVDGAFHTVTATASLENRSAADEFNTTIASEGDSFEWDADGTGRQDYYCSPHVGFMYGSVDVN
ncbi:MAG: cupredoxin domain-containing protein [Halobacteriota archaeon]|uniref:cupredoxin domain-containing protein n=1 Tax=Natronomonas sp. TaxID=2184060 RepID=UPI0039758171